MDYADQRRRRRQPGTRHPGWDRFTWDGDTLENWVPGHLIESETHRLIADINSRPEWQRASLRQDPETVQTLRQSGFLFDVSHHAVPASQTAPPSTVTPPPAVHPAEPFPARPGQAAVPQPAAPQPAAPPPQPRVAADRLAAPAGPSRFPRPKQRRTWLILAAALSFILSIALTDASAPASLALFLASIVLAISWLTAMIKAKSRASEQRPTARRRTPKAKTLQRRRSACRSRNRFQLPGEAAADGLDIGACLLQGQPPSLAVSGACSLPRQTCDRPKDFTALPVSLLPPAVGPHDGLIFARERNRRWSISGSMVVTARHETAARSHCSWHYHVASLRRGDLHGGEGPGEFQYLPGLR
jgi:hypothetical protein